MPTTPGSVVSPALYGKLLTLQLLTGAGFSLAVYLLGHGRLGPGPITTTLGYGVGVVAAATIAYVLIRLRPRLPRPLPGQDAAAYLASPETLTAVLHLWIMTGGAGVACWLGLGFTGVWFSAVIGSLVLIIFLTLRPAALVGS